MRRPEEIRAHLIGVIAHIKRVPETSVSDDLAHELALDSLDTIDLATRIATDFHFDFGAEVDDIDAMARVSTLVQLIEKRQCAS